MTPDRSIPELSAADRAHMARALALAERGLYTAPPNPRVGSVIVKDGAIIGEGFHRRTGEAHAEIHALREAREQGRDTRGATLYVTLEPCNHHGRTPPCVDAILAAGIARVVASIEDPNPRVRGGGFAFLRGHGVHVEVGLGMAPAARLNQPFFTLMRERRPFVILKARHASSTSASSRGWRVAFRGCA